MRSAAIPWIYILAGGGSTFASFPAQAQQVTRQETGNQQGTVDAADDTALGDIFVTARRRPEPLQRTPVSVVAFSAKDLEARSLTNLRTLQNFVPNLTFAPAQFVGEGSTNAFIRGIGQEDYAAAAEPGVGFYVDGVYFARSTGTLMNLIDVERVEVLRGPQGTLFGKNAIGGAINLVSVRPQPRREGEVKVILGSYARGELRGVLNEPLSDTLLVRLSVAVIRRDGYLHRLRPLAPIEALEQVNGSRSNLEREGNDRGRAGRLQLRWLPSDTLTLDLSADLSRKRDTQGPNHIDAIDPQAGIFPDLNKLIDEGKLPGPPITADFAPKNLLASYATGLNSIRQDLWGASATLTGQLGTASVKLITAYRGYGHHFRIDGDGLYFNLTEGNLKVRQHQRSAELQISGVSGPLSYIGGVFALKEKAAVLPTGFTCGCFYLPSEVPPFTTERRSFTDDSVAAYAQGTYRVTDELSATLGGRFSHERKSINNRILLLDAAQRPTDLLVAEGSNRAHWNSLTYRAGVEYQATRDIMAYGSVAKGFKSGGFNSRSDEGLPNLGLVPFKPETALTWEAGVRSEWLHRKLRLNATLFTTQYTDIQLRQLTIIKGIETNLIENAARARISGAELELAVVPTTGLTLSAAYGHIGARYLDVGQVANLTLDSRFQRTPRNTFTVSADYEIPIRLGVLDLRIDYNYRSKEQFQLAAAPNDQSAYGLLGARLNLRSTDERWSVALFGTNLTDKLYRTAGRGTLMRIAGFVYSSIGLPRQIGVQLTHKY